MSKERSSRDISKINDIGSLGEVQIADDVVATIAGLAATEVEGVAAMYGNITKEIVGKLGIKNLSKGVKVVLENKEVFVEMAITIQYGFSVPEVAKVVQERTKTAIENMTGLSVSSVDVKIAEVNIDNYK